MLDFLVLQPSMEEQNPAVQRMHYMKASKLRKNGATEIQTDLKGCNSATSKLKQQMEAEMSCRFC